MGLLETRYRVDERVIVVTARIRFEPDVEALPSSSEICRHPLALPTRIAEMAAVQPEPPLQHFARTAEAVLRQARGDQAGVCGPAGVNAFHIRTVGKELHQGTGLA